MSFISFLAVWDTKDGNLHCTQIMTNVIYFHKKMTEDCAQHVKTSANSSWIFWQWEALLPGFQKKIELSSTWASWRTFADWDPNSFPILPQPEMITCDAWIFSQAQAYRIYCLLSPWILLCDKEDIQGWRQWGLLVHLDKSCIITLWSGCILSD